MDMFQRTLRAFPNNLAVEDAILLCSKSQCLRQEAGTKQTVSYNPKTLNYNEISCLLVMMVKSKCDTCFTKWMAVPYIQVLKSPEATDDKLSFTERES